MKSVRYRDDVDYSHRRLEGTLVYSLDKTRILFVKDVYKGEDNQVFLRCTDCVSRKDELLLIEDVCLEPLVLGMTFILQNVAFLMRYPYRQYKQGVNWNNTKYRTLQGGSLRFGMVNTVESLSCFALPGLGLYPTLGEAKEMLDGGIPAVPLSRDIALLSSKPKKGTSVSVFYRSFQEPVGSFRFIDNSVSLNQKFDYLKTNPTINKFVRK